TAVKEAAAQLVAGSALTKAHRLQLVQALLTGKDTNWIEDMLTRRKVKLHVYHCSSQKELLADVTQPDQREAAVQAIQTLQPTGKSSQLGSAVRQVLGELRGRSLTAIIMLTDGVTTEGEDLIQASSHAAQMGVPLFFVGIGDNHEARDLILHDLQVEES